MKTYTATDARSNLFKLLKTTIMGHAITRIASKDGAAILISEDDYESLMETAELLSIPGFKKSIEKADREIEKGEMYSLDEVFK